MKVKKRDTTRHSTVFKKCTNIVNAFNAKILVYQQDRWSTSNTGALTGGFESAVKDCNSVVTAAGHLKQLQMAKSTKSCTTHKMATD